MLDDIYLLHPLWPPGDQAARQAYILKAKERWRFTPDVRAEEVNLRRKHEATVEKHKESELHYVDNRDPRATCGAAV